MMDYEFQPRGAEKNDVSYSPRSSGSLDNVFGDRVALLRDAVKQLEYRIGQRKVIREQNLQRILQDSCYVGTALLNLPQIVEPLVVRVKSTLEDRLARLQKESREEDVAAWKDLQTLYTLLADARKEYLQFVGRARYFP